MTPETTSQLASTLAHRAEPEVIEMLLFEHSDGRHAAAQAGAAFLVGDPGWHRVGPVEVHVGRADAA